MESNTPAGSIGTLNEKPLHAALKEWCARPGDRFEVPVDGYVIDLVRGDLLIEVQTGNFTAIRSKLRQLLPHHPVRLVYPIAREKWIVKQQENGGKRPKRRKSPKRGGVEDLFVELVRIPELLHHPHFSVQVLLIQEEELRRHDPNRRWRRRGWVTEERRLLQVVDQQLFQTPADLVALIPPATPDPFTTADLAHALDKPRWLAQKMAYCLRKIEVITPAGKQGRSILYTRG